MKSPVFFRRGFSFSRYRLIVTGRVQGVGFRWYTVGIASRMKVSGWVQNLPDGSVEILAEGGSDLLEKFCSALCEGVLGTNISYIELFPEPGNEPVHGFRIVR
ncbi:MAG: acylphosphatase [Candidatus Ratteibacteria bacterium]